MLESSIFHVKNPGYTTEFILAAVFSYFCWTNVVLWVLGHCHYNRGVPWFTVNLNYIIRLLGEMVNVQVNISDADLIPLSECQVSDMGILVIRRIHAT